MKNAAGLFVLLGVLGIGFLAGTWHTHRERVSATALRARRVLYYVDPMHPSYKSEEPGVAPDCGMALEPIYDNPADPAADRNVSHVARSADGSVRLGADTRQTFGVRVSQVAKRAVNERLRLYGRVAPDETRVYTINVGIDGFIRQISRVTTGSQVRKGEWLATFSAPEARSAIQGYLVTLDVLERTRKANDSPMAIDLATAGVRQSIDRLLTLGMSSQQIDEVARTRQVPATIRIAAPEDGFVVARNVSVGQKLERGDELFQVADLRRVWILADVFGGDAEYVKPGTVAQVFLPGRSRSFPARVSTDVSPQFDADRQAVHVRLEADNPSFQLRPDMFVDVELPVTLPPTIAVPTDAILDAGVLKTVFVERSEGVFEARRVETGWRFGPHVEIVAGLNEGDRVVISGAFLLDSESRMRRTTAEDGLAR